MTFCIENFKQPFVTKINFLFKLIFFQVNILVATNNDIPSLLPLVNAAYRGEASKKGWTTEADLISGESRIDAEELTSMIADENAVILLCKDDANELLGCVYLQKRNLQLYLGMFSVWPDKQGAGIGKHLLQAAEKQALEMQCTSIIMSVINVREELIAWYNRHGYSFNGQRLPFPNDPKKGIPQKEFDFIVLEKKLR
jgi:ribosomal protein S18 acetylase RimI-like enzyme